MASLPIEEEPRQPPPPKYITMRLQEEIIKNALEVLEDSDYLVRRSPDKVYNQMIQMLGRCDLTHDDTALIKGMINKVYHTLRIQNTSKT